MFGVDVENKACDYQAFIVYDILYNKKYYILALTLFCDNVHTWAVQLHIPVNNVLSYHN